MTVKWFAYETGVSIPKAREVMAALGTDFDFSREAMPFMAMLGLELEEMGWGTEPGDVEDWFPPQTEFHVLEDVGHFVHIEQPDHVAGLIVEFLS